MHSRNFVMPLRLRYIIFSILWFNEKQDRCIEVDNFTRARAGVFLAQEG